LNALSAASLFAVAVFALAGSRRSAFATTLALLTADLAGFSLAQSMELPGHVDSWRLLDISLSPFAPLLGLLLVLRFTGDLARHRRVVWLASAYFGLLAAMGAAGFVSADARRGLASAAWPSVYLLGLVPCLGFACLHLMGYARRVSARQERRRAWGMLLGLVAAIPLGLTDLLADLDLPVPRLSALAGPIVALVLAALALGAELFEQQRRRVALVLALGGAALVLVAHALLRVFLPPALTLPSLVVLVGSLYALLFAGTYAFAGLLGRARRERLAYAGRMARQLAHDLNTPLAALRGAVDYLAEERRREGAPRHATEAQMFELLDSQLDRMAGVAARYQRLLRQECEPTPCDLRELSERALVTLRAACPERRFELDAPTLVPAELDAALMLAAMENVLKNAAEACAPGDIVTLRARAMGRRVCLEVEDHGVGMNPRALASALEGGQSEKAEGQGLGLPFARRVCALHGGELRITSTPDVGTAVTLLLPARAA